LVSQPDPIGDSPMTTREAARPLRRYLGARADALTCATTRSGLSPGIAESKSEWFPLFIKARSEKQRKFAASHIKRLVVISE
jgi:hypothetical protein